MLKKFTGINIQWPISEKILNGEKSIETRTYPLPEKYKSKELVFIETPGKKGKFKSRIVAIIKFSDSFEYKNKKQFYDETSKHLVTKDSEWAWKDKAKWGWKIEYIKSFPAPIDLKKRSGIIFTTNIEIDIRKAGLPSN